MQTENNQNNDSFFEMVRRPSVNNHELNNSTHVCEQDTTHLSTENNPIDTLNNPLLNDTSGESILVQDQRSLMPYEARRVLVYLMRQGAILASENIKLFDSLCRYEDDIRRHLAEVYLQLILDEKQGIAFIINVEQPEDEPKDESQEDFPVLIRKRTLTLYDTLVLLILRQYYQERETAGEQKIIIDIDRIQSSLVPYIPLTNHDSKDRKKLNGALDKFSEKKVLSTLRGEEGRYEITPIIRYVVNAEFLQNLLTEYQELAVKTAKQTQGE